MIFHGILTSIAKMPYIFVIFQGGPTPVPASGSAHENNSLSAIIRPNTVHKSNVEATPPDKKAYL